MSRSPAPDPQGQLREWKEKVPADVKPRVPFGPTVDGRGIAMVPLKRLRERANEVAALLSVPVVSVVKPRTATEIADRSLLVCARGVIVVDPGKEKMVRVLEVWRPFTVVIDGGKHCFVATKDKRVECPVKTVEFRFLEEAHTPYYMPTDIERELLPAFCGSLVCCRLPTGRVMAASMSSAGMGCIRCGRRFQTLAEWARHYESPVPTRLPWTTVSIESGELVYRHRKGILEPNAWNMSVTVPHLQSNTLLCARYKEQLADHAKRVISDATPRCLKRIKYTYR